MIECLNKCLSEFVKMNFLPKEIWFSREDLYRIASEIESLGKYRSDESGGHGIYLSWIKYNYTFGQVLLRCEDMRGK